MTATTPNAPRHTVDSEPRQEQRPRPGVPRRRESTRPARCAAAAAAAGRPRPVPRRLGSPPCRRRGRSSTTAYAGRSRRSASAFRCWSSLWSALSSVFWSRPRKRRATSPSYDSSVLTNVPPSRGSSVWTWIALMPNDVPRPGDPPRRLDVLDRRRDRPRPRLPAELRSLVDPSLERDGLDRRVPARPAADRGQHVPGNLRSGSDLDLGRPDDRSAAC